jgi:myo-inositol-1(or 4)-monophosphatase
MNPASSSEILQRIRVALEAARSVLSQFTAGSIEAQYKTGHDPVTVADRAVDDALRKSLLRNGEGWFSEECLGDAARLTKSRVWVVDPIDGTREFVAGIPEFCVAVAMVEDGRAIAGGICNPATKEVFLGSIENGLTYNGKAALPTSTKNLAVALILASRREVERGEWNRFSNAGFRVQPMGSVAYKLARVAAGFADVTFTLSPKHEWDVAAGVALVNAAGGFACSLDTSPLAFNRRNPLLAGLVAGNSYLRDELLSLLKISDVSERTEKAARIKRQGTWTE